MLEELGKIPAKTAQRFRQETNLNVLARWHRCAAKASSISEFEAGMAETYHGRGFLSGHSDTLILSFSTASPQSSR